MYLNNEWQPSDGGCLRLFDPGGAGFQVKCDIEPMWNRLLMFWSTEEVPHEVLPAFKDRFAVSVWYICAQESLGSADAFRHVLDPSKARCLGGEDRRAALLEGAAAGPRQRGALAAFRARGGVLGEEEREALAEVFPWHLTELARLSCDSDNRYDASKAAVARILDEGSVPSEAFRSAETVVPDFACRMKWWWCLRDASTGQSRHGRAEEEDIGPVPGQGDMDLLRAFVTPGELLALGAASHILLVAALNFFLRLADPASAGDRNDPLESDEGILMDGIYYGKRFFQNCQKHSRCQIPDVPPPIEISIPMAFEKVGDWSEDLDAAPHIADTPASPLPIGASAAFERID